MRASARRYAGALSAQFSDPETSSLATPGLKRLLAAYGSAASTRGVATFGAVPTASQVAGLQALGLVVQPMKHVPLAIVSGSVALMETAVAEQQ